MAILGPVVKQLCGGSQIEIKLSFAFGFFGTEQRGQVVISQVFVGGGRAIEGLGHVLGLGVQRWAHTGRGRFVPVEETLVAELMEVPMAREAGTFFSVGATARALSVTPGWTDITGIILEIIIKS